MKHAPNSVEEAAETVRHFKKLRICGSGAKKDFGCPIASDCDEISTEKLVGIREWSPDDLVVVAGAGTKIADLQRELATKNQGLPIPPGDDITAGLPGTVGGLVAANLPTRWDAATKGVRYWVLGLHIVRADGAIAKCGSKAVKNVAGYDAQKAFVGSYGTLGLITDVILRAFPRASFPSDDAPEWRAALPLMIARTKLSDVNTFAAEFGNKYVDESSGTVWAEVQSPAKLPKDSWAIYAGLGKDNITLSLANLDIMQGLKHNLDPGAKFNPGILGEI
jgi:glycolate oxidase FAD binding subunit